MVRPTRPSPTPSEADKGQLREPTEPTPPDTEDAEYGVGSSRGGGGGGGGGVRSASSPPPETAPALPGGRGRGPSSTCLCEGCEYECCPIKQRRRALLNVDRIAMELRIFVADQERMAADVRRYQLRRDEFQSSMDLSLGIAKCLEQVSQSAPNESAESLAAVLGELAGLRAALGPVVDAVLINSLHQLRDLRRLTGGIPPCQTTSFLPTSVQELRHYCEEPNERNLLVTFPSEAPPGTSIVNEWKRFIRPESDRRHNKPCTYHQYFSECDNGDIRRMRHSVSADSLHINGDRLSCAMSPPSILSAPDVRVPDSLSVKTSSSRQRSKTTVSDAIPVKRACSSRATILTQMQLVEVLKSGACLQTKTEDSDVSGRTICNNDRAPKDVATYQHQDGEMKSDTIRDTSSDRTRDTEKQSWSYPSDRIELRIGDDSTKRMKADYQAPEEIAKYIENIESDKIRSPIRDSSVDQTNLNVEEMQIADDSIRAEAQDVQPLDLSIVQSPPPSIPISVCLDAKMKDSIRDIEMVRLAAREGNNILINREDDEDEHWNDYCADIIRSEYQIFESDMDTDASEFLELEREDHSGVNEDDVLSKGEDEVKPLSTTVTPAFDPLVSRYAVLRHSHENAMGYGAEWQLTDEEGTWAIEGNQSDSENAEKIIDKDNSSVYESAVEWSMDQAPPRVEADRGNVSSQLEKVVTGLQNVYTKFATLISEVDFNHHDVQKEDDSDTLSMKDNRWMQSKVDDKGVTFDTLTDKVKMVQSTSRVIEEEVGDEQNSSEQNPESEQEELPFDEAQKMENATKKVWEFEEPDPGELKGVVAPVLKEREMKQATKKVWESEGFTDLEEKSSLDGTEEHVELKQTFAITKDVAGATKAIKEVAIQINGLSEESATEEETTIKSISIKSDMKFKDKSSGAIEILDKTSRATMVERDDGIKRDPLPSTSIVGPLIKVEASSSTRDDSTVSVYKRLSTHEIGTIEPSMSSLTRSWNFPSFGETHQTWNFLKIASSPIQLFKMLLGPQTTLQQCSHCTISPCQTSRSFVYRKQNLPTVDFLEAGFRFPNFKFILGRTLHQAAADSIQELTLDRTRLRKVKGRSCSMISSVFKDPSSSSDEDSNEESLTGSALPHLSQSDFH